MKRFLLLLVALPSLFWGHAAIASACASSSLSTYVTLGASGCTVGGVSFGDFHLNTPQAGAVVSSAILVTPVMVGPTVVGLRFDVSPTSSDGNFYDDLISYRVVGSGATVVVGATLDFAGSSATGDAAVSVLTNLCLGGAFLGPDPVSGCSTGNTRDLAVIDIGFGPDPATTQAFGAVSSVGVVTDIAYDSGSGFVPDSLSTLTSALNLFTLSAATSTVPEPSNALLLMVGVFAWLSSRRRRSLH